MNNDVLIQESNNSLNKWGEFLAILAIVATFFTLFCFTFIEAYAAGIISASTHRPKNGTQNSTKSSLKHTPSVGESLVAHSTQPLAVTHKNSKELDFVSIDKLIKRTRMQWQRSKDGNTEESRVGNLKKAKENIAFLKSIGIEVEIDKEQPTKLVIKKREIA